MVFACQLDSFRQTLTSKVLSCAKSANESEPYYEVVCEDSILFPEGGGQPWDTGFINEIPVHKVLRRGDEAVMYTEKAVHVGQEVKQSINWERRFDHMQQHSGQHLITAIIKNEYEIDTTSWWLGEKVSHIELDTKELAPTKISTLESVINKKILEQIPVNMMLCNANDEYLKNARTRGLPKDMTGPIRIIEIVGIESDMCCGTHVTNLAQLQCVKLLNAEKGKKNKINLTFVCGGRVLRHLTECLIREQHLTRLLKNQPSFHVDLVEKLQQNMKSTNKKLNSVLKVVAEEEADKFKKNQARPLYYCHHNKDASADYLDAFWRQLRYDGLIGRTFFLLGAGEEAGNILLHGNEEDIKVLGPKITDSLRGKGVTLGTKFQAKVMKLSNFKAAEEIVKDHFEQIGNK